MRSRDKNLFTTLGLDQAPWSVRVYLVLLVLFAVLVLVAAFPGGPVGLSSLASDGLKTVLGALLGALSSGQGRRLRGNEAGEI